MAFTTIHEDMFNMICGEKIGSGAYRDVFLHKWDKKLVIKVEIEQTHRTFANVFEHHYWTEASEANRQWLAPVVGLSPDGKISFMERTCALPHDFKFPSAIPRFLRDIKPENFGLYKGRLVCHDYHMLNINLDNQLKKHQGTQFYNL